ncbi:uncharacterized protein LOC144773728 [Lissotriton helveticus]
MADYYDADDDYYYGDEDEGSLEHNLVEELDRGVQHSVNKALVHAINPLTRHLNQYAQQQGWLPASKAFSKSPVNPHKSDFQKLPKTLVAEASRSSAPQDTDVSDDDHNFASEHDSPPPKKRVRKEHFVDAPERPSVLTFEPADIVHPNSSSWLPSPAVAAYVQAHIRQPFDAPVRARLRSECPRPDIADHLADTPEVDPMMVTYLKKYAKDPKKGLDRSWRSCQDKLLDMLGPLTKILDLGFRAKEASALVDPDELIEWAQRAVCQLGNANCAVSSERRRSILLKLDPKLAELSSSESGPEAQGLLFGQPFLKELTNFVSTFNGIDKAQASLRRAMRRVFARARRPRGRSFGRGSNQQSQRGASSQRGGGHESGYSTRANFYPSHKGKGQYGKGRSGGQQGHFQDSNSAGSDQK